jgi:hypothetical protein
MNYRNVLANFFQFFEKIKTKRRSEGRSIERVSQIRKGELPTA